MKIELSRASDDESSEIRDLASLDDLRALLDEFRCGLIIDKPMRAGVDLDVCIYDTHIE